MANRKTLSEADHRRISEAVAKAEARTSGEIVTIMADRSDGYTDVALAWSVLVAFLALSALALAPDFYTGLYERLFGGWGHEWTHRGLFTLALGFAVLKFAGMLLIQLWPPLKFALVPSQVKTARAHERAVRAFRIGAERRTTGRTGVLIYLSMREHRAEIVADEAIASKVDPDVWGDAMAAMLAQVRTGAIAEGMVAAIEKVGDILEPHFPVCASDVNELPDRLIEV